MMSEKRACDGCTLCCKMLGIPELQKPMGTWCPHVARGRGCTIYAQRPHPCRAFECLWLTTDMPDYWKPDRCKMVVAGDETGTLFSVIVDSARPEAWKAEPYYSDLKRWAGWRRWRVQVLTPGEGWIIFPEEDLFVPDRQPDDTIVGYGYKQHGQLYQPAVSIRRGDGTITDIVGGLYPG
jgi:hypothetical protein